MNPLVGYELRDTRTSLLMGTGNVVVNVIWKLAVVAVYAALYELTPLRLDAGDWWVWVLLFCADDLAYYWFDRVSHESRVFWASHIVHHSSQHYNLSTALRQTWVPMTYFPFWLPLPLLGFRPGPCCWRSEYIALGRDLRAAGSWRARWNLLLRGPGYEPPTSTGERAGGP